MDDCILTAENVVKSFGKFRALDGASLSIPKGCIFGIIGPNGAGKSTLLRIVTSLAHPDSGRVTVNGIDVEAYPKKALKGTGAIVDSPAFYPDLTARRVIDICKFPLKSVKHHKVVKIPMNDARILHVVLQGIEFAAITVRRKPVITCGRKNIFSI